MKKLQEKLQAKAKGFTLVELIVVVIIIGILAAIAIPRMMDVRKTAQNGADEGTARTIISMAVTASMDFGGDLAALEDNKTQADFIKKINDSVDVKVVHGIPTKDDEFGVKYDPTKKTVQVFKKDYVSTNDKFKSTTNLVYEK